MCKLLKKDKKIQMDGCLCQIMDMDECINDMFTNFNFT